MACFRNLLFPAVFLFLAAVSVHADTYTIPGIYSNLEDLRTAGVLQNGDIVILSNDETLSAQIAAAVSIRSADGTLKTIDLDGLTRLLETQGATTAAFDNVHIINGSAFGDGGAIFVDGGAFAVRSADPDGTGYAVFENNSVSGTTSVYGSIHGGAVSNLGGTTTIDDVLFQGNRNHATVDTFYGEALGGALYNSGTLTIRGTATFDDNHATFALQGGTSGSASGGGFYNQWIAEIENAVFTSNSADRGGGLTNVGNLTITTGALFENNVAQYHGGAFRNDGTANLINAVFNENSSVDGGAIYNYNMSAMLTLTDAAFTGNTATGSGGAILNEEGEITLEVTKDTVYSGNEAANGGFLYMKSDWGSTTTTFDIAADATLTIGLASAADRTMDSIASENGDIDPGVIVNLLRKTNAGTLVLNADNSGYKETFEIEGGKVSISKADQIGERLGIVRFTGDDSDAAHTARIQITDDITFDGNSTDSQRIVIESGYTGGFTVDTGKTLEITGIVSTQPGGAVAVETGATFVLEGDGTVDYNGNSDNLGRNSIDLAAGANLELTPGTTGKIEFHDPIRGAATSQVLLDGTGSVSLWNTSAMDGDTTIKQGRFILEEAAGSDNAAVYGNTASGSMSVTESGTVVLKKDTTLNAAELILSGGTLEVSGTAPAAGSDTATIHIGNDAIQLGADGGTFNIAAGHQLTVSDDITDVASETGSLTKTGAGLLILDNDNDYSGTTTVTQGTLTAKQLTATGINTSAKSVVLNPNGTLILDIAVADEGDYNKTISGSGALVKAGTGNVALTADNSSYSGLVTVNAGILTATNEDALGTGTVQNNAALELVFDGTFGNELRGAGTLATEGDITIDRANTGFSGATTIRDDTLTLTNIQGLGTGSVTITPTAELELVADGTFSNEIIGTGQLTTEGDMTINRTNTNFSGPTTIRDETLTLTNAQGLGTSTISIAATTSELELKFDGTFANTFQGTGQLTTDGNITINQANAGFTGKTNVRDKTLTLTDLQGVGSSEITVSATGELLLDADGTFGNVLLGTGKLTTDADITIGRANTGFTGKTEVRNDTLTLTNLQGVGSSEITITADGELELTADGTFGNVIKGAGQLTTDGDITINRANTGFSGATTIRDDTLTLTNIQGLGSGSVTITPTAELELVADGMFSNEIIGTGQLTTEGDITINRANTGFSGPTTIRDETLTLTNAQGLGTSTISIASVTSELELKFDGTFGNTFQGTGQLTTDGNITINQANAGFTGKTNVLDKTLTLTDLQGVGSSEITVSATGELLLDADGTFGNVLLGTGKLTTDADITISRANTGFTGKTEVRNDTLTLTNLQGVGSSEITITANGELELTADGTFGNVIKGVGQLTTDGDITINRANTDFSGPTTVRDNTLTLTSIQGLGSGAVTINPIAELELIADGTFSNELIGSGQLTTEGDITINRANTNFSGPTTIRDETLTLTNAQGLGTSTISIAAATSELELKFDGTFGNTFQGIGQLTTDGNITINQANTGFTGKTNVLDKTLTLTNLQGVGSSEITVSATGELLLDADGTFGNVLLGTGKLTTDADITINRANTGFTGKTEVRNDTLTLTDLQGVGSSEITITADGELELTADGTFGNVIKGSGQLTTDGDITINRANTDFSGPTTVRDDTLTLTNIQGLGSGAVTIDPIAELELIADGTFVNELIGAGQLTTEGDITINRANTNFTGPTTVRDDTLTLTNIQGLGSGAVTVNPMAELELNADGTFANELIGSGQLTTDGTITIDRANTGFTGKTEIRNETLTLTDLDGVGSSEITINPSGELELAADGTFDNSFQGTGRLTTDGDITINRANTGFTGRTVVRNETLTLTDLRGVGSSEITVNAAGELELVADGDFNNSIRGTGRLTTDGDIVIDRANANFSGSTTIRDKTVQLMQEKGLGTSVIETASATSELKLSYDGTFDNTFQGIGKLATDGDLVLTGNHSNHTGITDLVSGRVQLGHSSFKSFDSQAEFRVNRDTLLTGNGTIGSLSVYSGGTVSPGLADESEIMGQFTLRGTGRFEDEAIYAIDVDGSRTYQSDETTPSSDRIISLKDVTISDVGTTLDVTILNASQVTQTKEYLIVDTVDGVTGQFAEYVEKMGFNFFQETRGEDLYLIMRRTYPDFGDFICGIGTPNACRAAWGMQWIAEDGRISEFGELFDALVNLPYDPYAYADAFAQLHGEIFATGQDIVSRNQRNFQNRIPKHREPIRRCDPCGMVDTRSSLNLWASFTGDYADRDNIGPYSGYNYRSAGLAFGGERMIDQSRFAGFAFGYDNGFQRYDTIRSSGTIDAFRALVYAGRRKGDWALDAYFGYTKNWHKTRRDIDIGTGVTAFSAVSRARYDDDLISTGIELGRALRLKRSTLTPSVAFHYIHVATPSIRETDGREARLSVASSRYDSLRMPIGAKWNKDIRKHGIIWTPELRAYYVAELADEHARVWTTYSAVPGSRAFYADSGIWGRHSALLGFGLTAKLSDRVEARLHYDHEFYRHTDRNEVDFTLTIFR